MTKNKNRSDSLDRLDKIKEYANEYVINGRQIHGPTQYEIRAKKDEKQ